MSRLGEKYELGERIGGGGMADVFRATLRGAEGFERPVAIKRVKARLSRDERFADMFISEARLAASLDHPNIVRTLDFDRDEEGSLYLVMELIDGVDLSALRDQGPLEGSVVVTIGCELSRALDYAHEREVEGSRWRLVHRDVSPHNIMLGWQGTVQLVDFGIAKAAELSKISQSGSIKGKIGYMSPEQLEGESLDGRSDLFALGVVLYELLVGERLFEAESQMELIAQVMSKPIEELGRRRPDLSPELCRVIMSMLVRERDRRASSAREVLRALLEVPECRAHGRDELKELLSRWRDSGGDRAALSSGSISVAELQTVTASEGTTRETGLLPPTRSASRAVLLLMLSFAVLGAAIYVGTRSSGSGASRASRASQAPRAALPPVGAQRPALVESTEELDMGKAPESVDVPAEPLPAVDAGEASADASRAASSASAPVTVPRSKKQPAGKGTLVVRVKPWAEIRVDGKSLGQTPRTIELPSGAHRLVLLNPSLNRRERLRVVLKKNKTETIERDWSD